MEVIENKVVNGGTLVLDDKFFLNCHYNGTTLLYSGGEVTAKDTRFDNCQLQFSGPAGRTIGLLVSMGMLKPGVGAPLGMTQTPSGKPQ
jgi:hypothetical protein